MSRVEVTFASPSSLPLELMVVVFLGTAVGTLLEYYSCTGGTNQAFKIVPVHQTIAQKKPAKRSGVVVQIVGIESKFCVASC